MYKYVEEFKELQKQAPYLSTLVIKQFILRHVAEWQGLNEWETARKQLENIK